MKLNYRLGNRIYSYTQNIFESRIEFFIYILSYAFKFGNIFHLNLRKLLISFTFTLYEVQESLEIEVYRQLVGSMGYAA